MDDAPNAKTGARVMNPTHQKRASICAIAALNVWAGRRMRQVLKEKSHGPE